MAQNKGESQRLNFICLTFIAHHLFWTKLLFSRQESYSTENRETQHNNSSSNWRANRLHVKLRKMSHSLSSVPGFALLALRNQILRAVWLTAIRRPYFYFSRREGTPDTIIWLFLCRPLICQRHRRCHLQIRMSGNYTRHEQREFTCSAVRSPSLGACNYPIFLSRRFHRPIYF